MAEKTKWYKGTRIQKPEMNKKQTKKTKTLHRNEKRYKQYNKSKTGQISDSTFVEKRQYCNQAKLITGRRQLTERMKNNKHGIGTLCQKYRKGYESR